MRQFLILCAAISLLGCTQYSRSDDRIYEVLGFVIEDENLDKNYGLALIPEDQIDVHKSNKDFLLSLVRSKDETRDSIEIDQTTFKLLNAQIEYNFSIDKCLNLEDVEYMLYQLSSASDLRWDNGRLKFNLNNKENWYTFSLPVFSKDGTKAVMVVRSLCDGLCGNGCQLMLKKENGKWVSQRGFTWYH